MHGRLAASPASAHAAARGLAPSDPNCLHSAAVASRPALSLYASPPRSALTCTRGPLRVHHRTFKSQATRLPVKRQRCSRHYRVVNRMLFVMHSGGVWRLWVRIIRETASNLWTKRSLACHPSKAARPTTHPRSSAVPAQQHLPPCLAPPSSAVGVTRMVSPPEGLITSPDDSRDFDETMR